MTRRDDEALVTRRRPGPAADGPGHVAIPFMVHRHHELAWAAAGSLHIEVAGRTWTLQGAAALWIPAATPHGVVIDPGTLAAPAWFEPADASLAWGIRSLILSPPLRELLTHRAQCVLSRVEVARTVEARILDLVRRSTGRVAGPALPTSRAARSVATALLDDPSDARTLEEWADASYVVPRTLQRAFLAETGRPFSEWRTEVRLDAALPLLERGTPVAAVARAVGYQSASGFIAAFRRRHGHTPTAWRDAHERRAS